MEDGAAEGAETLPYFTVNSTAVARARVRRVLLRAGEVREVLAREPRRPLLTASMTALQTVSGPGYCLITSMPVDWSVVFCAEEVFLAGGMRAEAVDGRCTPYSRAPPV